MLHKSPYLRLTLFYVLIVMTISILFSVIIYNISSNEIDSGLGRQTRVLRNLSMMGSQLQPFKEIEQIRLNQLEESRGSLQSNLIYLNLVIFIISSGLSYFLAKRTMHPIEETLRAQNCFTADASHELRTPLTAMKTEVEVALRDENISLTEAKTLLKSNLEEIAKLESLSDALLKAARSQEAVKTNFEEVSLSEIVIEAYEKVESLARKKSIIFENHLEDLKVSGDRQSLRELFVILLDNAIKYSGSKSKITITVSREKKHAVIIIKDHGIGIKASDLPYIFNRFYRVDGSRSKEEVKGYGLGLSIARNIAEMHGGIITVESEPNRGSEFKLIFPLL